LFFITPAAIPYGLIKKSGLAGQNILHMSTAKKHKPINPSSRRISLTKRLTAKKKIVVVDDDQGIRDVLQIILERAGYNVELHADANQILKNNFSKPDLFVIDRLLSGMDGLDVCKYLKEQPLTKDIPVIMISAAPGIDALSQHAGADDFLEKPFDRTHLLQLIEQNIFRTPNRHSTGQEYK